MKKEKVYPYDFRKEFCEKHGDDRTVRLMWELKGPKNTACEWLSCYVAAAEKGGPLHVYLVQTWDVGRSVYTENTAF